MNRHFSPKAFNRARWFAELSSTLDEANHMLATLVAAGAAAPSDAGGLQLLIMAIRGEIDLLNRVSFTEGRIVGPAWPSEPAGLET